tara:strand:+ start:78 stop:2300 length:2223 start_codon:yes stop_codon:yes gene_type:complete
MMRVIGNDQNLPRQEHAIASGTLTNGKPVVVNADGTVSTISGSAASFGAQQEFEDAATENLSGTYDTTNDRIVFAYPDGGHSLNGKVVAGTVDSANNTISFGTPVRVNSAFTGISSISVDFDTSNGKLLIVFVGNSKIYAKVGTVDSSDNSISLGSLTEIDSGSINMGPGACKYDPDTGKFLIVYNIDGGDSKGVVATVSGTSVSFGTKATWESSANTSSHQMVYDTGSNKFVVAFLYGGASLRCRVATISGTDVSFSNATFIKNGNTSNHFGLAYDSTNNKIVAAYSDPGNSNYGTASIGTVGTTCSFSGATVFESATSQHVDAAFNPTTGAVDIAYKDNGNSQKGTFVSATISSGSLTFSTAEAFTTGEANDFHLVHDPDSTKMIIGLRDHTTSQNGVAVIRQSNTLNLTSENYIGIANSGAADGAGVIIDTQGAIADVPTTNYNLNVASFSNKSYNIGRNVNDIAINNDGTKIYYITDGSPVGERTLSTADDISTAGSESTFDTSSQDNDPRGVTFSPDGTKMYITGDQNDKIYQYTLSTAFDVTSASYASKSVSSAVGSPFTTQFKSDGTKMYVVEASSGTYYITEYTLSTAFDVSTASYTSNSFNTSSQTANVAGIFLNPDGTQIFAVGQNEKEILQYNFGTAFDLSTLSYSNTDFSTSSQTGTIKGVTFNSDGSKMYVGGDFSSDTIYQYSTTSAFTPAQSFFVQTDGTLGTTADDPSVFAGTAVSETKLIVKG